jgi:DNA-binding NarL/FixJ family response regulator
VIGAGVDDMPTMIIGWHVLRSRHHPAQQVVAADDQSQLFARTERKPDREQVDIQANNLSGCKLLNAIETMGWYGVRGVALIEVTHGRAQAAVGPLVLQYRRAFLS